MSSTTSEDDFTQVQLEFDAVNMEQIINDINPVNDHIILFISIESKNDGTNTCKLNYIAKIDEDNLSEYISNTDAISNLISEETISSTNLGKEIPLLGVQSDTKIIYIARKNIKSGFISGKEYSCTFYNEKGKYYLKCSWTLYYDDIDEYIKGELNDFIKISIDKEKYNSEHRNRDDIPQSNDTKKEEKPLTQLDVINRDNSKWAVSVNNALPHGEKNPVQEKGGNRKTKKKATKKKRSNKRRNTKRRRQ